MFSSSSSSFSILGVIAFVVRLFFAFLFDVSTSASSTNLLYFPNLDPASRRPNEPLFSPDQGLVPMSHKYNLDVVAAQLRTHFCYARFIVYRPFVYKALHFPELMTANDANCCALAIQSCCIWPVSMAPPKNKKRLVPHLFIWTQNFTSILLILRMTQENRVLGQICDEHVNPNDVKRTVTLMLDWMRDVKYVDGIANWSWRILEPTRHRLFVCLIQSGYSR
jgi:hypothetical protein